MNRVMRNWVAGGLCLLATLPALAWEMSGEKTIFLTQRDGAPVRLGTVVFSPKDASTAFALRLDHHVFKDYFLSMKEFKCVESPLEIQCHVPYPYPNPATVTASDLRWLEHSLLFLFKSPKEFGAKLWNGLYYVLTPTDEGLVGTPQAIDLTFIGAPPANPSVPPYGSGERSEIPLETRSFPALLIR